MFDPFDNFDTKEFAWAFVDTLLIVGLAVVLVLPLGEMGVMAP